MKNMTKERKNVLASIKDHPDYSFYAEAADVRIRFAVEIFQARKRLDLSQAQLAKETKTSQKVLSHIENADVNMGIETIMRLSRALKFTGATLAKIFDCPAAINIVIQKSEEGTQESISRAREEQVSYKGSSFTSVCERNLI